VTSLSLEARSRIQRISVKDVVLVVFVLALISVGELCADEMTADRNPEAVPMSDAGYPTSASVEVPVKIEVGPRRGERFNLRASEVEGMRVWVCTDGVQLRVADTVLAADSVVVWQPLSAEKKTTLRPCTRRYMLRVTSNFRSRADG